MTTFGFQLRFLLSEDEGINYDGEHLEILLPSNSNPLLLKPVFGENQEMLTTSR